jgi:undecaprenyl-diphosphatase
VTAWEALILALVQGFTEFLPVSSSGHLLIMHAWLGVRDGALAFDLLLHLGTLLAVMAYFWRDWLALFKAVPRAVTKPSWADADVRLLAYLVIATVPATLIGGLFNKQIEGLFHASNVGVVVVATTFIVVGIFLVVAEYLARHDRTVNHMTWRDALWIGLAQALALIPGVSRSGITMLAGLVLGLKRPEAARFSFLMSAPIIAGASLLMLPKLVGIEGMDPMPLAIGFLAATIAGFVSIHFLLRIVQALSFKPFAYYRVAVGIVIFGMFFLGLLPAAV